MSGIGHLAAGFAAKPAAPKVPLWALLVASEVNDLAYFLFTAVGLEQKTVTTMDFNQGVRYITSGTNPWSHGLFMSLVMSVAGAVIAYIIYRDRRSAGIVGLVVFSHWVLDFLIHSNLPLFLNDSPLVGLGLENTGPGFIFMTLLDLVILTAGIIVYLRSRKPKTPLSIAP
jgi:hypothetical protein